MINEVTPVPTTDHPEIERQAEDSESDFYLFNPKLMKDEEMMLDQEWAKKYTSDTMRSWLGD